MKDLDNIRPHFDLMIHRWIRNGQEQFFAKKQIVESENQFEIRDAKERLAFFECEAGVIRDELVALFVEKPAKQPTFCDKYEFQLQQIWSANNDIVRTKRLIVKAVMKNNKIEEAEFRDELKSKKVKAELATERLYITLITAAHDEQRIA